MMKSWNKLSLLSSSIESYEPSNPHGAEQKANLHQLIVLWKPDKEALSLNHLD